MLAGGARTFLHRYGVLAGRAAVVFTTDDSAYAAAVDLADAGVAVRPWSTRGRSRRRSGRLREPRHPGPRRAGRHRHGRGRAGQRRLVAPLADGVPGESERIACDLLLVSGAGTPRCTCSARPAAGSATTPRSARSSRARCSTRTRSPGPRRGVRPRRCLADGRRAAVPGLDDLGVAAGATGRPPAADEGPAPPRPLVMWRVPDAAGRPAAPSSSTCSATPRSPTSPAPSTPACARSSTSSATRRSGPRTTRARPPA